MIGFTGASRTGKTTLARICAENLGFTFHEMKTAEIMAAAGYENVGNLSIDDRIKAQTAYLDHYEKLIEELPRPVIVDRTPIDLIGYLMAEVGMHATTPEQGAAVSAYASRALNMADRSFGMIFAVRPLGHYQEALGKAPGNRGYQWHTQFIMEGALGMLRQPTTAFIREPDLETRVGAACDLIVQHFEENAALRASSRLH